MGQVCNLADGSCKTSNKVYGIVNHATNKLHRLTFSKSLANHIIEKMGNDYRVERFQYDMETPSSNQPMLYGIVSNLKGKTDLVLRIALTKPAADLLVDNKFRRIEPITLKRLKVQ